MKTMGKNFVKNVLLITLFFFPLGCVYADESEEAVIKQIGFVYTIHHPKNQIGESAALNLKMTPGQEQKIPVTIENKGDKELALTLSINGARTNYSGGLEYGPNEFDKDKSMKYDLPDLVKIPTEVTIPPKENLDITVDITMPKEAYDGIVTGGIQIQEKETVDKKPNETGIVNKMAYLFGVTLQMTDTKLSPSLNLKKVYPEQENYRNAIFLDIVNKEAMKLEDVDLDIKIKEQNKKENLYETKRSKLSMAPNTVMNYPVSLEGKKMLPGKYTAYVSATSLDKSWNWKKDFTITKEQADSFNEEDVSLVQERGMDWKLVIILVVIGLAILMILILLVKKKKR